MRSNFKKIFGKQTIVLALSAITFLSLTGAGVYNSASASKQLFGYFVNSANNAGYWAGKGTIVATSGEKETLKCKATYFLSKNGIDLKQNLRCASESYNIRARSKYVTNGNTITGSWHEETFNIRGNVSGKSKGNKLSLEVKGQHVNATMAISVNKCSQKISILPIKAPIKLIEIRFGRC
ncbi:MAG: hypothetical protein ACRBBN_10950 [Methyloligellaceae bacterium]